MSGCAASAERSIQRGRSRLTIHHKLRIVGRRPRTDGNRFTQRVLPLQCHHSVMSQHRQYRTPADGVFGPARVQKRRLTAGSTRPDGRGRRRGQPRDRRADRSRPGGGCPPRLGQPRRARRGRRGARLPTAPTGPATIQSFCLGFRRAEGGSNAGDEPPDASNSARGCAERCATSRRQGLATGAAHVAVSG